MSQSSEPGRKGNYAGLLESLGSYDRMTGLLMTAERT